MAATRSRDGSKAAPKAPSEEPGRGDLFFVDNKGSKGSKGKKGKKGESDVVKKASGKGAHVSTESSHEAEWERILFGVNAGADNDDNEEEEEADHASLSGPESADADADDDSGIASDNEPAHAQKGRQRTTRKATTPWQWKSRTNPLRLAKRRKLRKGSDLRSCVFSHSLVCLKYRSITRKS